MGPLVGHRSGPAAPAGRRLMPLQILFLALFLLAATVGDHHQPDAPHRHATPCPKGHHR